MKKKYLIKSCKATVSILLLLIIAYVVRLFIGSLYYRKIAAGVQINLNAKIENGQYYIHFGDLKEDEAITLDSTGVVVVNYSKVKSLGVKNIKAYNPVTIGLMGIVYFQNWENNNSSKDSSLFFKQANWFVHNTTKNGDILIYHDKVRGNQMLKAPWVSCLSQGMGISVLTRAFKKTKDSVYLYCARRAMQPLEKSIQNGGVRSLINGQAFYEEYPLKRSNHVLNGFIYSLFGLYDLYKVDGNKEAKKLFEEGIKTLKMVISQYDLGNWSKYSLNPDPNLKNHWNYASPFYQKLHAAQMQALYQITKDSTFKKYAEKFKNDFKHSRVNYIIYPSYVLYSDAVYFIRLFK